MRHLAKKHILLLTANAAIWSLTSLMWSGKVKLSAVKRVEIEVTTTPARVKIFIDGAPHEGGTYITTPATLRILPGKHRITFQRTGYHSNSSTIVTTLGSTPDTIHTVLEAMTPNMQEVHIEAVNPDEMPNLELSLDGGLEAGPLPLTAYDLLPGTHILEMRSGFISKSSIRCQFEVSTLPSSEPLKITLEKQGKKLRITGCKRLKN